MKLIIAGSRDLDEGVFNILEKHILRGLVQEVVVGGARGVDLIAEEWAQSHGIPIKRFIPDWQGKGQQAGILRNIDMANYGTHLLAIWDCRSKGTQHMFTYMRKLGKPTHIIRVYEK